ncbi:calmodulin-binding transcription activator 3-like [Iris pallida]|uniref:Calmodulin-binding transcription activator 3-like n=1 Tax=Iris pallida TaxID=29817 RepID=A0AAX6HJD6_IRIPA|nr:calmodulin-binding transcription activator 3-like [Iris pallida]
MTPSSPSSSPVTPSTDPHLQSRRRRLSDSVHSPHSIEELLLEAQHRWLRPTEICEILRNYRSFHIAPEPANRPPSGSLFLFDRKVLRYFRKDGHNWRKKRDGKTVKEAHERLKAESVDVLHCYYAHGEDNENFQRRTYWMLEESFMHIVLVHYLEVKGSKGSSSHSRDDNEMAHTQMDSPVCSSSFSSQNQLPSQATDAGSFNSAYKAEYEDADSVYLKRDPIQQIVVKQDPDTALSLGYSMKMEP